MKSILKIGLVDIVIRDFGVKLIWSDLYWVAFMVKLVWIDLDWVFSFSYTLIHEQARKSNFSHIEGF